MVHFGLLYISWALTTTTLATNSYISTALDDQCKGASLISNTTLHVDNYSVSQTTHMCQDPLQPRQDLPTGSCATNVCCTKCQTSCSRSDGVLPPSGDDCLVIEHSVSVLANYTRLTFDVLPSHMVSLTYGSCAYYIRNWDKTTLEYCFSDLSAHGREGADACFPPREPFFSEGLCTGNDGKWVVIAARATIPS